MNEEKFHRMELLKDPLIVVTGEELVARELVAREHQPAARGRAQHQPTKIGPRAQLQHPAAAPLVQDGHYGC